MVTFAGRGISGPRRCGMSRSISGIQGTCFLFILVKIARWTAYGGKCCSKASRITNASGRPKQGLEKAWASGSNSELVAQGEKTLDHAVDLATQQFDRTKTPRDPIPANMDEARKLVDGMRVELVQRGLLAQSVN